MNDYKELKIGLAGILLVLLVLAAIYPGRASVIGLILGGVVVAPEAAEITYQYIGGQGEDLYLESDYIKNSPVILRNLDLKPDEVRRVAFNQHEDWRLSYALNPFHIQRYKDGYRVFQYIDYGHGINKNVVSQLNLGLFKVPVYDNIVHSFDCVPFTVYFYFTYPEHP